MAIVLGPNQYGKAENRVVRVIRDSSRHEIRDLNVSTSLRGDFHDAHVTGDQAAILPTDTQKNAAFAFAKAKPLGAIEDYALNLAEHLLAQTPNATGARVSVEEYEWQRIQVGGVGHDHSFVRDGQGTRNTIVTVDDSGPARAVHVVSGIEHLTVAKTTGSEFRGFLKDEYTTLPETTDRILATSLVARWRYAGTDVDWDATHAAIKALLLERFATIYSRALQQTLYGMGEAVLEAHPAVAEIKFSAPNKHHFLVTLLPPGTENPGEVFIAADRPYGLIEASVVRDDAPDAGSAWSAVPAAC
ncbi:urate oxidase [Dactylosporangium roseum]|uniref:Uricase n=1 Tax=Dactylosporangium roseum TaxID=47989 RepID=A0ABY5Z126_9ACTN|nr:urate oxidase [Dactylosporangium roseum]UWZ34572.1 urate oxidase [Dactylosporangium roseum]